MKRFLIILKRTKLSDLIKGVFLFIGINLKARGEAFYYLLTHLNKPSFQKRSFWSQDSKICDLKSLQKLKKFPIEQRTALLTAYSLNWGIEPSDAQKQSKYINSVFKSLHRKLEKKGYINFWSQEVFYAVSCLLLQFKDKDTLPPAARRLLSQMKKSFFKPHFFSLFISGDYRHSIIAGKASFALMMSYRTQSYNSYFWWVMYLRYASLVKNHINLCFDAYSRDCAPQNDLFKTLNHYQSCALLSLVQTKVLNKTRLLTSLQKLPRYIRAVSPYTDWCKTSKGSSRLNSYVLSCMYFLYGYVSFGHILKTFSSTWQTTVDFMPCIFGQAPAESIRNITLYPSHSTSFYSHYSKANKVIIKYIHPSRKKGIYLYVPGNNTWGLHRLAFDSLPYNFRIWVWTQTPSNGKWIAKPLKPSTENMETSGDFLEVNGSEKSLFTSRDNVSLQKINEDYKLVFDGGNFIILQDYKLHFYFKDNSIYWFHGSKGRSSTLRYKCFKL